MKINVVLGSLLLTTSVYGMQQHPFVHTVNNEVPVHGRFLHLTDIHMDKHYVVGATVKSDCHHSPDDKSDDALAGYWGTPISDCDSAPRFVKHSIQYIADAWKDKIDFIIWTGDNARHDGDADITRTRKEIIGYNEKVTELLKDAFQVDNRTIPIVPCIGNNDIHPHNELRYLKNNPQLNKFSEIWKDMIPEDQLEVFRKGGYFAVDVAPRIRVLSLNTLYFFSSNDVTFSCSRSDSGGHMHILWIKEELKRAKEDGVRVILMGHVPPTVKTFKDSCLDQYIQTTAKYEDVIIGHMYGHSNMDHFQILSPGLTGDVESYEDSHKIATLMKDAGRFITTLEHQYKKVSRLRTKEDLVVVHVAPPIIPLFYPTFRVNEYEADQNSGDFGNWMRYSQFFSNLTYWNEQADQIKKKKQKQKPEFELEYSTNGTYQMTDLTSSSWLDFAEKLSSEEEEELWKTYLSNMFVQTSNDLYDNQTIDTIRLSGWWNWIRSLFSTH
ncbi:Metallo-dependent phosphatase-like protein [Pilobolus umbonatus]|nr:Metallo-dependent phosphatase-like protein [Pilobolus umbonatus]